MTIKLPLQPQEEARLEAIAHNKGLSTDALVREALYQILANTTEIPDTAASDQATGALLVDAMQAAPYKEIDLEAVRVSLPIRDIAF